MMKKPKPGTRRVVIRPGQVFRGVVYFDEPAFDVSENYAEQLVKEGVARFA